MKKKKQIEIDLEVYKAIVNLMKDFDETPNSVLRRIFRLDEASESHNVVREELTHYMVMSPQIPYLNRLERPVTFHQPRGLFTKGIVIDEGTKLRASYKGAWIAGVIVNGAVEIEGKRFNSLSGAAMHVTKIPVSGWTFWELFNIKTNNWEPIKSLRKKNKR